MLAAIPLPDLASPPAANAPAPGSSPDMPFELPSDSIPDEPFTPGLGLSMRAAVALLAAHLLRTETMSPT
jgi:hypothetical protein